MISRQRFACPYGSGAAVVVPSAASGAVAEIERTSRERTAREQPIRGSYADPVEKSSRSRRRCGRHRMSERVARLQTLRDGVVADDAREHAPALPELPLPRHRIEGEEAELRRVPRRPLEIVGE